MKTDKTEFRDVNLEELKSIIDNACVKKHVFSNYFGIDLDGVRYYGDEDNIFILKPYDGYSRVYLMANDEVITKKVLRSLPLNSCINIPSKKGIDVWLPILEESDYKQIATYRRYAYVNYRKGNNKNLKFAELSDLRLIESELHSFFSPLTGHLPNKQELTKLIEGKQIVVNRDDKGIVNGALCYQITGKKAELPFWFDRSGDGLSLLFNVFFLCHQQDIRQILFWVNDDNTNTIAIHTMLGAKTDGLVDYIFNKEYNMNTKVLEIINEIRAAKNLAPVDSISNETKLREDLSLTSFDLAELTVKIEDEFDIDIFEDGLVSTIGEIYAKLS